MFDMNQVGRTISGARREKNMTQMELADRLGVSFQAVSNWERGQSMPDISKLPELSEILGLTIDRILGKPAPLVESFAQGREEDYLKGTPVTPQELAEAAPILKPSQVDEAAQKADFEIDLDSASELMPFLGREACDKIFNKLVERGKFENLDELAPFVSRGTVDQAIAAMAQAGQSVEDLLPFASRKAIGAHAWQIYEKRGFGEIEELAPFIARDDLSRIVETEYEKNGVKNLEELAPFIDRQLLTRIVETEYEKNGFENLDDLAPFIDRKVLTRMAGDALRKRGFSAVENILPFLDKELLTGYINKLFE